MATYYVPDSASHHTCSRPFLLRTSLKPFHPFAVMKKDTEPYQKMDITGFARTLPLMPTLSDWISACRISTWTPLLEINTCPGAGLSPDDLPSERDLFALCRPAHVSWQTETDGRQGAFDHGGKAGSSAAAGSCRGFVAGGGAMAGRSGRRAGPQRTECCRGESAGCAGPGAGLRGGAASAGSGAAVAWR